MRNEDEYVTVECPPCIVCRGRALIAVRVEDFKRWAAGALVQEAFPDLTAGQREMLLNGTHPRCFDTLMTAEVGE